MGSTSLYAALDPPYVRPASSAVAEDLWVRVVGATLLQSVGMFLLLRVLQAGGPDMYEWLGLIYLATHVAVGLAVLGMRPQLRTLAMFVLPGFLLALVWAVGGGFWAGSWVLGLTAWAFILGSLSEVVPLRRKLGQAFWLLLGVAVGGLFIGLAVYIPNPLASVLAVIPGVLLLLDHYSHRPWRAALDCSAGLILLALLIMLPEFWLSLEASCAGVSALLGFGLTWLTKIRTS